MITIPSISYLTNRPQFLRAGADVKSETNCMNTDAPQGTMLSLFLFSLYTEDCRSQHENTPITKSADNTGLTALITDDDNSHCQQKNGGFVDYVIRTTSS